MVAFITEVVIGVLGVVAVILYGRRRPIGAPLSWGQAMLAATYAMFMFFWWYAVIPHQWLTWASAELGWTVDNILMEPNSFQPLTINMQAIRDDYVLQEVDAAWLSKAVKPKQFIHIDQSECIMCEGCVDICPWKCIHMVTPDAIDQAVGVDQPGEDPSDHVIMNSVLYHLHPVKVKRHAVKVSYTLCLGGLSFFLFILLTVTGIFLMFFYRPTAAQAWDDIYTLHTSVTFGLLVRNMHRWAAHLMVISVFLHMARVFYHGAYKPPREFNWVIGVILLTLTLLLSFTGYLLPWDQLALWAVTVGTNMMGYTPVFGSQVWFVLHVLMLPFVIVIFMAIHFWRVRKDGGISGPL